MTHQEKTHKTLSTLMSLMDEHKDELKEGEYLEICRMLKHIHSNPHIIPQPSANPIPPSDPYRIYRQRQPQRQPQPQQPQPGTLHDQARLQSARRALNNFDNARISVKLNDKLDVFRNNFPHTLTMVMGNPLYFNHNLRSKINVMEAHILGNGLIDKRALTNAYQNRRDQRILAERAPLVREVTSAAERLAVAA